MAKRPPAPSSETRIPWRAWLLVTLVALVAHGLCLRAGFYHDDAFRFSEKWLTGAVKWKPLHTAVTHLLGRGVYELFGLWSPAFHAVTLILHVMVAVLTFELARAWLPRLGFSPNAVRQVALWGALLFACHPLGSEVTNYARCSDLELVMVFSLLAALAGLRWLDRGWRWIPAMILAIALAGMSKGPGIWHALAIVGTVLVTSTSTARIRSLVSSPRGRIAGAGVIAFGLAAAVIYFPKWQTALAGRIADGRMGWHLLTQSRITWEYLQLTIWPVGLCSDHHFPWTMSTGDVPAWIAAAGVFLLVVLALWLLIRRRTRIYGALSCLVLFPILLRFPYVASELMVEYRMYPALPFACLIGALLLARLGPALARGSTGLIVVAFCLLSAVRSTQWEGPYAANEDVLRKYPTRLRAHWEIMRVDYEAGRYRAVLEREPAYLESVRQVEAFNRKAPWGRSYDLHHFAFSDITCRCYLARARARTGRAAEALAIFEVIRVHLIEGNNLTDPYSLGAFYHHRGLLHLEAGRPERALQDLRTAADYSHHTFPLAPSLRAAKAALAEKQGK
jgi:hypothetical protein